MSTRVVVVLLGLVLAMAVRVRRAGAGETRRGAGDHDRTGGGEFGLRRPRSEPQAHLAAVAGRHAAGVDDGGHRRAGTAHRRR